MNIIFQDPASKFMKNLSEKGIAHIAVLIILIVGLGVGLYLSQNPQIFNPRANVSNPSAQFVDSSGTAITQTTNPNVRLKIVRRSAAAAADVPIPTPTTPPAAPTPTPRLILQNQLPGGRTVPLYQLIEPPAEPTSSIPDVPDLSGTCEPGLESRLRQIRDQMVSGNVDDWYELQWGLNNLGTCSVEGANAANSLQTWIFYNKTGRQVGSGAYPTPN